MYKFYRCKEEELVVTLLAIIFEMVLFGIITPKALGVCEDEKWGIYIINIVAITITLLLFTISNKNMFTAYLLSKNGGEYKKAKIVKANVISTRGTSYVSLIIYIPEFGERYKWREQVKISLLNDPPINEVLNKYLFALPEVDIIIHPKKHKRFYVILEPIFQDFYRKYQDAYRIINYVLLSILILLAVYTYVL